MPTLRAALYWRCKNAVESASNFTFFHPSFHFHFIFLFLFHFHLSTLPSTFTLYFSFFPLSLSRSFSLTLTAGFSFRSDCFLPFCDFFHPYSFLFLYQSIYVSISLQLNKVYFMNTSTMVFAPILFQYHLLSESKARDQFWINHEQAG